MRVLVGMWFYVSGGGVPYLPYLAHYRDECRATDDQYYSMEGYHIYEVPTFLLEWGRSASPTRHDVRGASSHFPTLHHIQKRSDYLPTHGTRRIRPP